MRLPGLPQAASCGLAFTSCSENPRVSHLLMFRFATSLQTDLTDLYNWHFNAFQGLRLTPWRASSQAEPHRMEQTDGTEPSIASVQVDCGLLGDAFMRAGKICQDSWPKLLFASYNGNLNMPRFHLKHGAEERTATPSAASCPGARSGRRETLKWPSLGCKEPGPGEYALTRDLKVGIHRLYI